jgi:hypothetical protein
LPIRYVHSRRPGAERPAGGVCCFGARCRFANRSARPAAPTFEEHLRAREEYRAWVMAPERAAFRRYVRRRLKGRDLGCTCPLHLPCHVDVLLEVANGPEEARPPAAPLLARGSDGRTYALHVGGDGALVTSDGRAVARGARGLMWLSGTGVTLEPIPEAP